MSQTSYSIDQAAAFDGELYDISGANDILSGVAEESIVAGVFVAKGTAEKQVKLPAAAGDVSNPVNRRGFVVRDEAQEADANGELTYESGKVLSVLRQGRIWLPCEDAFSESDSVFVRIIASSPNFQLGAIRTDADTSNAVQLEGAKFLNSGAAGALALVQVDIL